MQRYYPISIVGGGIVGKTLAVALSKSGLFADNSICLVDSQPSKTQIHPTALPQVSNRVSFLAPSSVSLFQKILQPDRYNLLFKNDPISTIDENLRQAWPVTDMKVLDSDVSPNHSMQSFFGQFYTANFSFNTENMNAPLGYILENSILEATLDTELLTNSASVVDWFPATNLTSLSNEKHISEQWSNSVREFSMVQKDGTCCRVQTSLLVGSDGAQSKIRSLLDYSYFTYDFHQTGIVGTVFVNPSENQYPLTAYQRFLSMGPLALLPLSKNTYSFVWSVPSQLATLLTKELSEDQFLKALNLAVHADLPDLLSYLTSPDTFIDLPLPTSKANFQPQILSRLLQGSRASFPLKLACVSNSTRPQSVLIGDAAHSVHPLGGQGLNMGLADVEALVTSITKGLEQGSSVGDFQILEAYAKRRDLANIGMVTSIDILFKSFTPRARHNLPAKYMAASSMLDDLKEDGGNPSIFDSARRFVLNTMLNAVPVQSLFRRIAS